MVAPPGTREKPKRRKGKQPSGRDRGNQVQTQHLGARKSDMGLLKNPSFRGSWNMMLLGERGEPGHAERRPPPQLELFVAGSLEQLVPDDHVLARVDRVLDPAGYTTRSPAAIAPAAGGPGSTPRRPSG